MTLSMQRSKNETPKSPDQLSDLAIIHRLLRDYMGKRWNRLVLAGFCMVITAAMNGVLAWLLDPATKQIFLDNNASMLPVISLAIVGVVALRAITGFGEQYTLNNVAERVVSYVQRDMFASQIRLDIATLNDIHSGELVSKFLYDATLLRGSITRGVAGLGKELVTLVVLAGVMIYEDWQLALISVLLLPPVAIVTQRLSRSLRKSSTRGMEETGTLSRALSEALAGRRIVKAYGLEALATHSAETRIAQRLKFILRAVRARTAAVPSTDHLGDEHRMAWTMLGEPLLAFAEGLDLLGIGAGVVADVVVVDLGDDLAVRWTGITQLDGGRHGETVQRPWRLARGRPPACTPPAWRQDGCDHDHLAGMASVVAASSASGRRAPARRAPVSPHAEPAAPAAGHRRAGGVPGRADAA